MEAVSSSASVSLWAVTVNAWAELQLLGVKVRDDGDTAAAPSSLLDAEMTTL